MDFESMYGLNHEVKSLAIANDLVVNMNKACYALGQQLRPFCFYATDIQKQYGVIDFADFDSIMTPQKKLVDEICEYRKSIYEGIGIHLNTQDKIKQKLLLFDYLMSISICYVEIPKWVTKEGNPTQTYDKFVVTRNPKLMADWISSTPEEMQAKYSPRISSRAPEMNDNLIRFVKLNRNTKGNSITVPRSASSVEHMTCLPLFMCNALIQGFKTLIDTQLVRFSFLKDNGTVRQMDVTLSETIIRQFYSDNFYINNMINDIDINTVQLGGIKVSSKFHRGYIKVPEIGSSIYDTGVRSLNFARLLAGQVIQPQDVDTSFIEVDLGSVQQNFFDSVDYLIQKDKSQIPLLYKTMLQADPEGKEIPIQVSEIQGYVSKNMIYLSTTYQRQLHKFMVSNPQWFPTYTGKPNTSSQTTSSANFGVESMDF